MCHHGQRGGDLDVSASAQRLWFARATTPYPATGHYLAIAVAGVTGRQHPAFEELRHHVGGPAVSVGASSSE